MFSHTIYVWYPEWRPDGRTHTTKHFHTHLQKSPSSHGDTCGCAMCVFVRASCYELHAVVQNKRWEWNRWMALGNHVFLTALLLQTVQVMACIHKVSTVGSKVKTLTLCSVENKCSNVIKSTLVFHEVKMYRESAFVIIIITCWPTLYSHPKHARTLPSRLCDPQGRVESNLRVKQRYSKWTLGC